MTALYSRYPRSGSDGYALVAVLLIVSLVMTVAVLMADRSRVELRLASRHSGGLMALMNARSGLAYAQGIIEKAGYRVPTTTTGTGTAPTAAQAPAGGSDGAADPAMGWRLMATQEDEEAFADMEGLEFAVVVTDENGRVDANTATRQVLMALPGVTEELAAAVIDWRDADSTVTANGAEEEWYASLEPPVKPRNAPIRTLEELLSVKGMTKELFHEGQAVEGSGDDSDDVWPLADLFTVNSLDPNTAADGRARISLNTPGARLAQEITTRAGLSRDASTALATALRSWTNGTLARFAQTLPASIDRGRILDLVTPGQPGPAKGRVNVLTAPAPVLKAVFGEQGAEALMTGRANNRIRTLWDVYQALGQQGRDRLDSATLTTGVFRFDVTGTSGRVRVKRSIRVVAEGSAATGWRNRQWVRWGGPGFGE